MFRYPQMYGIVPPTVEVVELEGGERLRCHSQWRCEGEVCPIHKRTDHHMRGWWQHWRDDRHIMERICPKHGCGHPDPDDVRNTDTTHGCCGCCIATTDAV